MRRNLWITMIALLFSLVGLGLLIANYYLAIITPNATTLLIILLSISIVMFTVENYLMRRKLRTEMNRESRLEQEEFGLEIKLLEEKHRFETLFEAANTGIALLNLDGRIFRVNKSMCELLGYGEVDMLAMNFYYLIHPSNLNDMQIHIEELMNKSMQSYQSEQQCFRRNGEVVWILSTLTLIRDNVDNPIYFVLQVQNISLQKKAEEHLSHMAYHDPLTSLANRNKLEQFINHVLAASRRHQQNFALLFLDLDKFKHINDTIGHESGDILLKVVAERLHNSVRNTDMVARIGGDEFVLLISDVKKIESVAMIAQKILDNVMQVIMIASQEVYITTSIGISLFPYDGHTLQSLIKNADLALYRAKEHGRNNYQFYTAEMTARAQEKLAIQNALNHALNNNEFELQYQPKMDIKTRRITGVEVLLRWKNKEYKTISTDEVIAQAEESGLILSISEWIMNTACKQLKKWHEMGYSNLTLAVNCSSKQFKQASFARDMISIITDNGLSAHMLEIEVTETTIMKDSETILRVLYALQDLGVKICIDDFGVGYWSINNLRRLAVDKIKIDQSFIKKISDDEMSAAIISAIIAMANRLSIKSVAEGVETHEQFEFLAKEHCTEIQGYYLTQALSADDMTRFLKHPIPDAEAINKNEIMNK